jgi:hypothetical protein
MEERQIEGTYELVKHDEELNFRHLDGPERTLDEDLAHALRLEPERAFGGLSAAPGQDRRTDRSCIPPCSGATTAAAANTRRACAELPAHGCGRLGVDDAQDGARLERDRIELVPDRRLERTRVGRERVVKDFGPRNLEPRLVLWATSDTSSQRAVPPSRRREFGTRRWMRTFLGALRRTAPRALITCP